MSFEWRVVRSEWAVCRNQGDDVPQGSSEKDHPEGTKGAVTLSSVEG